ncbi:MAG TPA: L-erythro-3,5-diaminohexanoate dehydrogenase [Gaiellales bacterium]|jgi:L-erythro-3,5-diaminohexanoate dehydrogenase|nr:L-erythro-3,5-diaminohexanoate dehydrogenase [Gaiellales bacterium]
MPLSLAARYGLHRVLDGDGTFPQPAWKLDADPRISDAEILVDVERLNLDSASFRQLASEAGGDPAAVAAAIERIVAERGKLHNPVTGSGGMLVGTVREVGSIVRESRRVEPGQRIASLISLTLTPLRLDRVDGVEMHHGQVDASGTAVLFESSPFAVLPEDIPERIALAALDVAGAPSRTAALVRPGDTVLLVGGGGTAGLLTLHEARKHAGPGGCVVVTDMSDAALEDVRSTGLADHVVAADATDALGLYEAVMDAAGREADVAVNLVNVAGTELGTILLTRETGTILFFSMATSFTTAALGAEGLGRATTMLIGNGHMPDMGLTALNVLRESRAVRSVFERRYAA